MRRIASRLAALAALALLAAPAPVGSQAAASCQSAQGTCCCTMENGLQCCGSAVNCESGSVSGCACASKRAGT